LFSARLSDVQYIYEITPNPTVATGTWTIARKLIGGTSITAARTEAHAAATEGYWSWKTMGKTMRYASKAKVVMWPNNAAAPSGGAMYAYTPEGL
jgi:hypothetical protein